ncbi:hypothetical protein J6590_030264 [Homalodisca vitripennis]|nr:hypothetical protein J6590_030264 [Homalodisca vitripennis]
MSRANIMALGAQGPTLPESIYWPLALHHQPSSSHVSGGVKLSRHAAKQVFVYREGESVQPPAVCPKITLYCCQVAIDYVPHWCPWKAPASHVSCMVRVSLPFYKTSVCSGFVLHVN